MRTGWPTLGITAAMGRTFLPEEDGEPFAPEVTILGDGLWRGRFGADPSVIDKTLRMDGRTFQVVGVAPPGVRGDSGSAQFWMPLSMGRSGQLTYRPEHRHEAIAQRGRHLGRERRPVGREQDRSGTGARTGGRAAGCLRQPGEPDDGTQGRRQREIAAWQSVPAEASLVRQVLVENVVPAVAGGGAGALLPAGSMRLPALLRPESDGGSSRRCTRPCPCSRSASRYPSRRRFCLDLGPVS